MSIVLPLEETKTFVLPGMRNAAHKQHCVLPNIHKMICVTYNAIHFDPASPKCKVVASRAEK